MKKRIFKFIKKQWLLIWITAVAAAMLAFAVSAEYDFSDNHMKRVVVSTSDQGMMFSSNYLTEGGSGSYQPKYVTKDDEAEYYSVDVFIWNNSILNTAKFYPEDIVYDVEFKLTDPTGNTAITASQLGTRYVEIKTPASTIIIDSSDLSVRTVRDTLEAGGDESAENKYEIKFYGWDPEDDADMCLQMVARPVRSDGKYKDLRDLGGVIGIKEFTGDQTSGWDAYVSEIRDNHFNDSTNSNNNADGYNLILTGSGKATITIKWNTNHIEANKYFDLNHQVYDFTSAELELDSEPDADGWMTLTIHANTNLYRNRYNIQLYLKEGIKPDSTAFFAKESEKTGDAWVTYDIVTIDDTAASGD